MKPVKANLIALYGTHCQLCGRDCGNRITHHHIIPKYAGGRDTVNNGALLCRTPCHDHIHKYKYGSAEYKRLTKRILERRRLS